MTTATKTAQPDVKTEGGREPPQAKAEQTEHELDKLDVKHDFTHTSTPPDDQCPRCIAETEKAPPARQTPEPTNANTLDRNPTLTVELIETIHGNVLETGAVIGVFKNGRIKKGGFVDRQNRNDTDFGRVLVEELEALSNRIRNEAQAQPADDVELLHPNAEQQETPPGPPAGPPEPLPCMWCAKRATELALVEGELVCRACFEAADSVDPRTASWKNSPAT